MGGCVQKNGLFLFKGPLMVALGAALIRSFLQRPFTNKVFTPPFVHQLGAYVFMRGMFFGNQSTTHNTSMSLQAEVSTCQNLEVVNLEVSRKGKQKKSGRGRFVEKILNLVSSSSPLPYRAL
eukprot:6477231-Amphidinium_carterae.2